MEVGALRSTVLGSGGTAAVSREGFDPPGMIMVMNAHERDVCV